MLGFHRFSSSEHTGYRFGFNGMEKDLEVFGSGESYTAHFWQYDTRLGRRWNRDPVTFPDQSPYSTFHNNPIVYNDPDGDCPSCIGFFVGAMIDLAFQVGAQFLDGERDFQAALSMVDWVSVGKQGAIGAIMGTFDGGAAQIAKVVADPKKRYILSLILESAFEYLLDVGMDHGISAGIGVYDALYGSMGYTKLTSNQIGDIGEEEMRKQLLKMYPGAEIHQRVSARLEDGTVTVFDAVVVSEGKILTVAESKATTVGRVSRLTEAQKKFYNDGMSIAEFFGDKAKEMRGIDLKQGYNRSKGALRFDFDVNPYSGKARTRPSKVPNKGGGNGGKRRYPHLNRIPRL